MKLSMLVITKIRPVNVILVHTGQYVTLVLHQSQITLNKFLKKTAHC